uniref:Spectrin repeat-containing domain protein n=2 Tax=Macrostomum lignano TaxID=282301 RepID=A0A1I8J2E1_9PLAT
KRFDAVKAAALDRREKLRRAQEAAADFRARLDPLLAAMDACKKRVAGLGGGSTDPDDTSRQIEEHKAIVGSLAELQPQLRKAELSGRQLADLVGKHDSRAVMQELSDAEQQLNGLRAAVQEKMESLFQAADDLRNFIELGNSLSEWLCLADSQLESAYLQMQSVPEDRATVASLRVKPAAVAATVRANELF